MIGANLCELLDCNISCIILYLRIWMQLTKIEAESSSTKTMPLYLSVYKCNIIIEICFDPCFT